MRPHTDGPHVTGEGLLALLDRAGVVVVTTDAERRIRTVSSGVEALLGCEPGLLVGRQLDELADDGVPWQELREGQSPVELRLRPPGGRPMAVAATAMPLGEGGRDDGAVLLLRAAGERALEAALHRTQQRLAAAQRVARVGSWEWNILTGEVTWSDELYRLTGLEPSDEPIGYDAYLELVHPDDRARVAGAVRHALTTGESYEIVYRLTSPGESERVMEGRGAATVDASGRVVWLAGTARDVTDEHRVREERRRLEEEFLGAQKLEALALLSGEIAHDFSNTLTAIRGYGALVLEQLEPGSAAARDVIELLRTAEHAASLPRQLLAFARRKRPLQRELELGAAVRELEPLLRHVLGPERTMTVPGPEHEVWVRADADQVEQALVNLTLNARDAMEGVGGGVTIAIDAVEIDADDAERLEIAPGAYGALRVSDPGTGMDAATIARATEPFFTTKQGRGGTGLGLPAVAGGAAQAGGAVRITSEIGVGTMVEVILPAVDPPARRARAGADAPPATVLVVDDEPDVLAVVARMLGEEGHDVVATASAAEALERLRQGSCRPDLLVTDVRMPGLGGVELAAAARRELPGLGVLFLSGFPGELADDERVQLLAKPFSPEQLATAVAQGLERRVRPGG